ncbi:hypothetical protein MKQ68_10510 [Chitinophaga horti]|uniref:Glycosyl hydrolases family 43 n=1 Tax=Chitinophaga horti TaxID=2920382 RepID=A0ABY6J7F6_9BACT|nr:hypothetical protein [Chitinophaga horti]UYQ95532.1 hypothetical protein MKQ68_10510 [Chitinophaga horti]
MRRYWTIICLFFMAGAQGQHRDVSLERMQEVYEEVKTPFKYGLVIAPDSGRLADCPSVFKQGKSWYMTYIVFDGRGYETWLAKSSDLLQWTNLGRLLSFSDSTGSEWDVHQKAGYIALQDPKWGGSYKLNKFNGKYWMSYIGGKERGYETGVLSIGMANTSRDITKPHEWQRLPAPVLKAADADVRWWENKKLYKSSVIWDEKKTPVTRL